MTEAHWKELADIRSVDCVLSERPYPALMAMIVEAATKGFELGPEAIAARKAAALRRPPYVRKQQRRRRPRSKR